MVFKIEKNKNYTIMSNYHLRDRNLTLKAKGLLSFMLSLPEDWDYSLNGLCAVCKEGIDAIRSTLKELKENNYLIVERKRNEKGLFEYNYLIYEQPQNIEKNKENHPYMENPYMDKPNMENPIEINIKEVIDKGDKENKSSFFNLC